MSVGPLRLCLLSAAARRSFGHDETGVHLPWWRTGTNVGSCTSSTESGTSLSLRRPRCSRSTSPGSPTTIGWPCQQLSTPCRRTPGCGAVPRTALSSRSPRRWWGGCTSVPSDSSPGFSSMESSAGGTPAATPGSGWRCLPPLSAAVSSWCSWTTGSMPTCRRCTSRTTTFTSTAASCAASSGTRCRTPTSRPSRCVRSTSGRARSASSLPTVAGFPMWRRSSCRWTVASR